MKWTIDSVTQALARKYPVQIESAKPGAQYPGHNVVARKLETQLRPEDSFLDATVVCSPERIISEFKASRYLRGLALTISWGGMDRTKNLYVYRDHDLQQIHNILSECATHILRFESIERPWELLTEQLFWTHVMTSKTLHFLCRALGFDQDPPVPIDKARILDKVWPRFIRDLPPNTRPLGWAGNDFAAYSRYMTAILEWAAVRKWTTSQVEATLAIENF